MQMVEIAQCLTQCEPQKVKLKGHIYSRRSFGNLTFVHLRDRTGVIQLVVEEPRLLEQVRALELESPVLVEGELVPTKNGSEVKLHYIEALSEPSLKLPVEIAKDKKMSSLNLKSMLDYRPLTLRNEKTRAIFKMEAVLCAAFRQFLNGEGFTEIHSPKIVSTGTEGGAQVFKLDYFGRPAFLAQSPQFYKQMMVGVFERVFEIGPVYRAEEHDTSRHLNEYISMDFEMGFIQSEEDVINMQVRLLKYMFEQLKEKCAHELLLWQAVVPTIKESIPQIDLDEAIILLESKYAWRAQAGDLDPEGEKLLCAYFAEKENSELVYVRRYPLSARPFYTMPYGEQKSRSFDLLFRGLEITTGGQRIHRPEELIAGMHRVGLNESEFGDYLQCFQYGMPPHGGLAIGLERLAKQILDLSNVRLASLFPRDRQRISP
jgi:nondiscriminating aspartyl-tRNA synthetase